MTKYAVRYDIDQLDSLDGGVRFVLTVGDIDYKNTVRIHKGCWEDLMFDMMFLQRVLRRVLEAPHDRIAPFGLRQYFCPPFKLDLEPTSSDRVSLRIGVERGREIETVLVINAKWKKIKGLVEDMQWQLSEALEIVRCRDRLAKQGEKE